MRRIFVLMSAYIALSLFTGEASATKITANRSLRSVATSFKAEASETPTHRDANKNAATRFAPLIAVAAPTAGRRAATDILLKSGRSPRALLTS